MSKSFNAIITVLDNPARTPMTNQQIANVIESTPANVSAILSAHVKRCAENNVPAMVRRIQRGVWALTTRGAASAEAQTATGAGPASSAKNRDKAKDLYDLYLSGAAGQVIVPPGRLNVTPVPERQQPRGVHAPSDPGLTVTVTPHIAYRLVAEVDENHVLLRAPSGRVYLARLKEVEL